jgi:small subunit ribosomal protein S6
MEKKQYESVIILTPVLSEKQMEDAIASYRQLITENGGEVTHEENWGLTKLAYPIQKKVTGFYHIFEYNAPGDLIKKLELALRRDEQVMRYFSLALNKHAAKYNERRKQGAFNKKPKDQPAKEVAK